MTKRFNSAFTMFVFLRGHPSVQYYFGVRDVRTAANDGPAPQSAGVVPLRRVPDPERAKR
jgi:hypothetical protein